VGGYDLVSLVFVHEVSDPLIGLVKAIDRQLEEASVNRKSPNRLGVYLIVCNSRPDLKQQLQEIVAHEGLKHVVLTAAVEGGPKHYKIAREAELTAVVYENRDHVSANFALRPGELDEERARAIMREIARVLPKP
jgi:hypothetical protein